MSLLPRLGSSADDSQEGAVQLLGVGDERTDAVFEALSSGTARAILQAVYEEPRPPSELADHADTTVQNVLYHLDTLESVDLVEVAGTRYSEKGAEMDVYGPPDDPKVVFVGTDDRRSRFRRLVERLVGGVGVVLVASVVFHVLVAGVPFGGQTGAGRPTPDAGYPAGLAFLLGGLCALLMLGTGWYWADRLAALRRHPLVGGRDPATTRRFLGLAGGIALVSWWFWVLRPLLDLRAPHLGFAPLWMQGIAVVAALAVAQAFANDGLAVSWGVVALPVASYSGYGLGLAAESGDLGGPGAVLALAVLAAVVVGLLLGTGAFVVGAGARHALTWLRDRA